VESGCIRHNLKIMIHHILSLIVVGPSRTFLTALSIKELPNEVYEYIFFTQ
jgi:hypothetical protein